MSRRFPHLRGVRLYSRRVLQVIKLRHVPVILIVGVTIYFEWIAYFILPLQWPQLKCPNNFENNTRILFVADPQILDEVTETWIARTDCDSFLKSTFNRAMKYVNPHIIIFLGDLMDAGSTATSEEYEKYYTRFRNIFSLDQLPKEKVIFLSGDNDIGGEDSDLVEEWKVNRFKGHFDSSSITSYRNITFLKVDSILRTFPTIDVQNDERLRVLLSHIPLLGVHSIFAEEAISKLKPHIIFSAHDHKPYHFVTEHDSPRRAYIDLFKYGSKGHRFQLWDTGRINEIVIPTASYRMGTLHSGYSAALIDNKILCLFHLWNPSRLIHLIIYLVLLVLSLFVGVVCIFTRCFRRCKNYTYSKLTTHTV